MRRLAPLVVLLLLPLGTADDPNPPQMGAFSMEGTVFRPGDLVNVTVEWTDDSGMADVYMYGRGPADLSVDGGPNPEGKHGHGCSDPQEKRVVTVTCVLKVPERAPAGTYRITQVTGEDVIGHTTTHDPGLEFTVDSPYTDVDGPELLGLIAHVDTVGLDADDGMFMSIPQAFEITATDATGLSSGGLSFIGPGGNQGVWAQCEEKLADDRLACSLHAHQDLPAGDYVLDQVFVGDIVGYHSSYTDHEGWYSRPLTPAIGEPPVVQVVSNVTDALPPRLEGITFPDRVHRGEEFHIYLNFTDEAGIVDGHLRWQTTRGNAGHGVQFSPGIWHNDHSVPCEGQWGIDVRLRCTVSFPSNYPLGLARLLFVYARDENYNQGHFMPIEWGWNGDARFTDDDDHDVAMILTPRPLEGVLEAIDAVINEVVPGEVAEIVYRVQDEVDEVELILDNDAGDQIEAVCAATSALELGRTCKVDVPADAAGVFRLREANVTIDETTHQIDYADDIPLLAVSTAMPKLAYEQVASAGGLYGAANNVGKHWMERQAPKAKEPEMPKEEEDPVWAVPDEQAEEPAPLEPQPVRSRNLTFEPDPVPMKKQAPAVAYPEADEPRMRDGARTSVSTPGAGWLLTLAALALVLRRR